MSYTAVVAPAWMDDAACINEDPELFFPPSGQSSLAARKVCKGCPVAKQCLEYAIRCESGSPGFGVFGGRTPEQRRKPTRRRA